MYLYLTTADYVLNKRISQEAGFFVAPGWRYDLEEKTEADVGIYSFSEVGKNYTLKGKYGTVNVTIESMTASFEWSIKVSIKSADEDIGGYVSTIWSGGSTDRTEFSMTVPNDSEVRFYFRTKAEVLSYYKVSNVVALGAREYEVFHYQLFYPDKPFRLYDTIPKLKGYQFLHWRDWLQKKYAPGQEVTFRSEDYYGLYSLEAVVREYKYLPIRAKNTDALLRGEGNIIVRDGD